MPPRGESIGYALEDAIIFSHVLQHFGLGSQPSQSFAFHDKLRREDLNAAFKDASFGWDTNKDSGWFKTKIMEWITPIYIWSTASHRAKLYSADPRNIEFPPSS